MEGYYNAADIAAALRSISRRTGGEVTEEFRKAIASCEGEQYKFIEWAKKERYDMEEHPLHFLFMNKETDAARQGWKAALEYVRAAIKTGEGQ